MNASIWAYGCAIALLCALGGIGLERMAALLKWPRRHVWFLTLVASVLIPVLAILSSNLAPSPTLRSHPLAGAATTAPLLAPTITIQGHVTPTTLENAARPKVWERLSLALQISSRTLIAAWLITTAGLLAYYFVAYRVLAGRLRRWQRIQLAGQDVLLTDQLGPAVLGFLRPQIIVPRWVQTETDSFQRLMLAHEREHIAAGDALLILGGFLLAALVPWNLPLWWQLRRLRFAVEVDCDARVLQRGPDAYSYGRMLLSVGQHPASMPIGAMALIEPVSQLERRIRIMTANRPKHVTLWICGGLMLVAACVVTAATLQAPALGAAVASSEARLSDSLRKPPLPDDLNARVEAALEAAVHATYPEIFVGSKHTGTVKVILALNEDGSVYKSKKIELAAQSPVSDGTGGDLESFEIPAEATISQGMSVMDSPAYPHAVLVSYCVIKNGFDWTRSSLAVEKAVRNRYTDQFLPRGLGVMNRVTVYMNEAGQLDRARVDPLHYQGEYAIDNPDVARFVKLGLRRDQIGPMGESVLMNDQLTDHSHITYLLVSYAWPRRANESSGALITNPMANDPGDDPAVNLAIIEKNFPDAFTEDEHKAGLPWVLLGRDGSVQLAGRAPAAFSNSGVTQAYIEALLPGSKINGYFGTSVRNAAGKSATAQFLWLAANSPVTQLSQADLAMRKDVFLYTEVTWPATASARSTEDPLQRAGTPYFTVEDRGRRTSATWQSVTFSVPGEGELPGLLRWRVVGDASLQGDILMRLEVKSPGDASQWMPAGPERRVAYGSTTEYPWADSTGQIWKFAITPAALRVPLQ